jgi:uncharacterized protein (TIGR02453 family)
MNSKIRRMPKTYFTPKMHTFFRQLAKNNRREWFQPRKDIFDEHVRLPMVALVTYICDDLRKFAVDYVPPEPAKAMYRIYRDTRFSKDKTPYKLHIAAHFQHRQLPKNMAGGFYFAVSHTEVEIAGGIYMPGPDELLAVRQAIARQPEKLRKLAEDKKLVKTFGQLQGNAAARVPKGFDANHPAADLIRMKQLYFYRPLDAGEALKPSIRKAVVDRFKLLDPFISFFNDALLSKLKAQQPDRPKRPDPMF